MRLDDMFSMTEKDILKMQEYVAKAVENNHVMGDMIKDSASQFMGSDETKKAFVAGLLTGVISEMIARAVGEDGIIAD